jgi:4-alpha-glucanotransferase
MTETLYALAEAVGLQPRWRDLFGVDHQVSPDTIRTVLAALGVHVGNEAQIKDNLQAALQDSSGELPPLITTRQHLPVQVPGRWRVRLENGGSIEGAGEACIDVPGYHRLETAQGEVTLAVAPARCHALPEGRPWGVAVQLYALRRRGDAGVGDFGALRDFVSYAGERDADAVAISPVHAQFAADPGRFNPYAPSSRIMLNALYVDAPNLPDPPGNADIVDWPAAARARIPAFRRMFEAGAQQEEFTAFRATFGEQLETHARFEALHTHLFAADPRQWHWRTWPEAFRHPSSPAVQAFAEEYAREVAFHAYLQFLADRSLSAVQARARACGMRIGLITDLAVGMDNSGSQAWSRQDETLSGISIGSPPDLFNPNGQDWGVTTFSPSGLRRHGYAAFLDMLRTALRHAGGLRVDHVMGLQRVWVVPYGVVATEGVYLKYPVEDLLRLVALESQRHGAIIIGEDLGTIPEDFRNRQAGNGIHGLRVLWFEREGERFRPPHEWSRQAVAMTSTHDLAPVAGWWRGVDLQWRTKAGRLRDEAAERANRERDRRLIWEAFRESGAAKGEPPSTDEPSRVVDAAVTHVAQACDLLVLPIEDLLGLEEQPNLPGTVDEHPNWRRRLKIPANAVLHAPDVVRRVEAIRRARPRR